MSATAIETLCLGNFVGELFCKQGHLGAALVGADPAFEYKPSLRVEGACASGALAFKTVLDQLRSGQLNVGLVCGAEVQTTASAREGADYLARASHYRRQALPNDFTFPAAFAARMKACVEAGVFSMEDCGRVAVKAYKNANLNPNAHMTKVTLNLEKANTVSKSNPCFLKTDEKDFLRMTDCSQVSDGASAVILSTEAGLKSLGKSPQDCVEITACELATSSLYKDSNKLRMETSGAAACAAYGKANCTPQQIDVAEVHDCFTPAELLMYEACGFGKAPALIQSGATELEGTIPVNTGGGLVGFGHPVGATGIKQIFEIFRQMKGLCGDYQMKKIPTTGLCMNMGGDDKTAVCTILKNC